MHHRYRHIKFTLIEMLIVLSIFLILLSLFKPSLEKAIATSRSLACSNHLKQWALMFQFYTEEFNGFTPDPRYNPSNRKGWEGRIDIVLEHKSTDYKFGKGNDFGIFQCPENQLQRSPAGAGIGEAQTSYQPNGWDLQNFYLGTNSWLHENPSQLYALFDGKYYRTEPWRNDGLLTPYTTGIRSVRYSHMLGFNMLYSDGHTTWMEPVLKNRGNFLGGSGPKSFSNGINWYAY